MPVRARWLSRRAIFLHVSVVLFVPGCFAAAWWQITRAFDGNGLSYLYSVEWPIFAMLGVYFWWMFLHIDYDAVGLRGMRNQAAAGAAGAAATGAPAPDATPEPPVAAAMGDPAGRDAQHSEDPELAAYNSRLSALAASGPKTWRSPETHVARRPR
jgi:hypothetical protein